jgi:hypothetical protein
LELREWKKITQQGIYYPVFATYDVKKNKMEGACSIQGELRNVHKILVGKFGGKFAWGNWRKCEGNIKMFLKGRGWKCVD